MPRVQTRSAVAAVKKTATASRKRQAPTRSNSDRGSSPELGEDTTFVKRDKKTGKPIRKSAGKRLTPAGFIATDDALITDDDESNSENSTDEEPEVIKVKPPKRRRLATPPLSPAGAYGENGPDLSSPNCHDCSIVSEHQMSLTFNAPPGHEGPFTVKIDLNALNGQVQSQMPQILTPASLSFESPSNVSKKSISLTHRDKAMLSLVKQNKPKAGFLDLAWELRNDIYHHALVTKDPIDFRPHNTRNLEHSAALLLTCRQVYEEARVVLYSGNSFRLCRDNRPRGHYYEEWAQVGWKDIHRFLTSIGPINMSHLRTVHLSFENPPPRDEINPSFVNDEVLIQCLKLFAQHGALKSIEIEFHGKVNLKKSDDRFLHHIKAIKADELKIAPESTSLLHYYGTYHSRGIKIDKDIRKDMEKKMLRVKKLYPVEKA